MTKEELEKINKDYKEQLFDFDKERTELRRITHRVCKERRRLRRRNEELKKENAELKNYAIQLKTESAKRDTELTKGLTKAKEIIHKVCYEFGIYDKDLMEKAKQFLKEYL